MKPIKKMIVVIFAFLIFISLVIAIKNQVPYQEDYGVSESDLSSITQWITITIDGNSVGVDAYAQNVWYDIPQLTTERDLNVNCSEYKGCTVTVNGIPIESQGTISLRLDQLGSTKGIEICVSGTKTAHVSKNYIRTLPLAYNNVTILNDGAKNGYYYFNLNNYIYKVSTSGDVVFYKTLDFIDNVPGGYDFKRTEVDGQVFYSYLNTIAPADKPLLAGVDYARACAVVLDQDYNEVDRIEVLKDEDGIIAPLANCQFMILGEKHYLISAYVGKRVYNFPDSVAHSKLGARVVANIVQEIYDGQVLWEWDSTDYPELYAMSEIGNDYYNASQLWADYAHIDSIVIDPSDNNYVIAFRNLNAVIKLDRETGQIIWILGGRNDQYGLSEDQLFEEPYDVRLTDDGGVTIFDSGSQNTTAITRQSRVLKFYLDENQKRVINVEQYQFENNYSENFGSVQELSAGHYMIGWGKGETPNAVFSEIDFNTSRVLFELCTSDDSYTYRVYKDIA